VNFDPELFVPNGMTNQVMAFKSPFLYQFKLSGSIFDRTNKYIMILHTQEYFKNMPFWGFVSV